MPAFQTLQQSCLVSMNGIVNILSTSSGERNYHQSNLLRYCSSRTARGLGSNDLDTQPCCLLAGSLAGKLPHTFILAFKIYPVSFRDQRPFQIDFLNVILFFLIAKRHTVHLWTALTYNPEFDSMQSQFEIISEAALSFLSNEYCRLFFGGKAAGVQSWSFSSIQFRG